MCIPAGNLLVVPVVKMIGLTMGLTVWGVTNMLNGWFQGRYMYIYSIAVALSRSRCVVLTECCLMRALRVKN